MQVEDLLGLNYLDTLPAHPQPQKLESLTSYLTRVAEANCITSPASLKSLLFPKRPSIDIHLLHDSLNLPLADLQMRLACPEPILRATTFFHLENKFGKEYPNYYFLKGCLASFLRYCPLCLRENTYYSLLWRFSSLKGCAKHGCRLLEKCEHCNQNNFLFSSPLKMGICRLCGEDFRKGNVEQLPQEVYEEVLAHTLDLTFLLTPQPWEEFSSDLPMLIGRYFTHLRFEKGISLYRICQDLDIGYNQIVGLERTFNIGNCPPFSNYLKYASYLGVSWSHLFTASLQEKSADTSVQVESLQRELDIIIEQMHTAVIRLMELGKTISEKSICEFIGLPYDSRKKYPSIYAFIKQIVTQAHEDLRKRHDDAVLLKVQRAIEEIESSGKPLTVQILREMGVTPRAPAYFNAHPRAKSLLIAHKDNTKIVHRDNTKTNKKQTKEQQMYFKVQMAIRQLKENGQCVTQHAVSEYMGLSISCLLSYPSVKSLLKTLAKNYIENRRNKACIYEQGLLAKVEETIQQLEACGESITQLTISHALKSTSSLLKRYPQVKQVLEQYPYSF